MIEITTIVPVYNASKFLKRCLESLIAAQIPEINCEIILIDDGSTDDSLSICKKYAQQYPFIKVLSQNNKGPSIARNEGKNQALGKYITFVDSDDFVTNQYYKMIYENLSSQIDVLIFGYYKTDYYSSQEKSFNPVFLDKKAINNVIRYSSQSMDLIWFPWTKVYRKEVIEKIEFNEKINIGEDTIFNLGVFSEARFIKVINPCLYHYVSNEGSLTQTRFRPDLLDNMINHYNARLDLHSKKDGINTIEYKKDIALYYVNHILFWLIKNINSNPDQSEKISSLHDVRDCIIYKECFPIYHYSLKNIKKSILIKLFQLRKFKLLLKLI